MAIVISDVRDLFLCEAPVCKDSLGVLLQHKEGKPFHLLKTQFCFLNSESLTSGLHIVMSSFRLDPV
jgi:hypothetical protein